MATVSMVLVLLLHNQLSMKQCMLGNHSGLGGDVQMLDWSEVRKDGSEAKKLNK